MPCPIRGLAGRLGIKPHDEVVIVPAGTAATDFAAAARVYWTLKLVGHGQQAILDGGFKAWTADPARPVESGLSAPKSGTPYPVVAQQSPDAERIAAARALIEAQGGTEQARKAYDQMMTAMTAEIARRSPGEVDGFKSFMQTHCSYDSGPVTRFFDGVIADMIAFYAERCSVEELEAMTAFVRSPAGRKLTAIAPEAATVMLPKLLELQKGVMAEVKAAVRRGELKK